MSSGSRPTEAARSLTDEGTAKLVAIVAHAAPGPLNAYAQGPELLARLLAETERLRAALRIVREYLRDPALPNDRDDMRRVIERALRGVPPGQQDGDT